MADQVAQRQSMHRACAASLMLLFGACSTGEQVVAPTGTEQAGFVPSAPPDNPADPAIVTAGDLVEQKRAPEPAAPQSQDSAKAKPSQSGFELSAGQVAALIAHSRAEFTGECPCPYDVDKSGRSCGKRSAYSSTSTSTVLCYPKDLLPQ